MISEALFSSKETSWETPREFFKQVDDRFHFTLDVCASAINRKVPIYITQEMNAFAQKWAPHVCWCNPPYGRGTNAWVVKAALEAEAGATTIMLVPARTDTKWFKHAFDNAAELFLIEGRLKFGGSKNSAPFPSCMFHFTHKYKGACRVSYWRVPSEA